MRNSFQNGEYIFHAGEVAEKAYFIEKGSVKIIDQTDANLYEKGEIIGETEMIFNTPYQYDAIAIGEVMTRSVGREELNVMLDNAPEELRKIFVNILQNGGKKASQQCEDSEFTAMTTNDLDELGFEKIADLLDRDDVNDILINKYDSVYIEKQGGKLEKTQVEFDNDEEVIKLAENITAAIGKKFDRRKPMVDARLLNGSRVNIISPPLSVDGTSISIRKFAKKPITINKMIEQKNVSEGLGEFIKVCARCRLNIIISGGTGSGKTTLLNAISQHIGDDERIVTIEDAAELQLSQPNIVRLETRPKPIGADASYNVNTHDLVRNALRMRPDRIIVGEVRGSEAFDMMQAMNTGHEGSLTTIHANHPRDALSRLENMINMNNLGLTLKATRQQISSAIQLIVQISRMRDGHRRITFISEITGIEGDTITMHDLFKYSYSGETEQGRLNGEFEWSGIMPRFLKRAAYYKQSENLAQSLGVKLPQS